MVRCLLVIGLLVLAVSGCSVGSPTTGSAWPMSSPPRNNPALLAVADPHQAWEMVVDVVDDHFRIESEEPVRRVGNVLTEGRLETFPATGSTFLEPWRHDSATSYEKLESTLQSIRRRASVRVIPVENAFRVEVAVFKELEDVLQPAHSSAGAAAFRNDSSLSRIESPVGEQEINKDWIPMGRDTALEQRILEELIGQLGPRGPVRKPQTVQGPLPQSAPCPR